MGVIVNDIRISEEAKFDYEIISGKANCNLDEIRLDVMEYMIWQQNAGRLRNCSYFRVKYYDETSDKMLMLFFYLKDGKNIIQFWELSGICEADDWTEELEDSGNIRAWLKTKINDLEKDQDWVLIERELEKENVFYQTPYKINLSGATINAATKRRSKKYSRKLRYLRDEKEQQYVK